MVCSAQVTVAVSKMNDEVALHDLYSNQSVRTQQAFGGYSADLGGAGLQVCFRLIEQSNSDMERVLSLVGAWYASYLNSRTYNPDVEWRLSTGAMAAAVKLLSKP